MKAELIKSLPFILTVIGFGIIFIIILWRKKEKQ